MARGDVTSDDLTAHAILIIKVAQEILGIESSKIFYCAKSTHFSFLYLLLSPIHLMLFTITIYIASGSRGAGGLTLTKMSKIMTNGKDKDLAKYKDQVRKI